MIELRNSLKLGSCINLWLWWINRTNDWFSYQVQGIRISFYNSHQGSPQFWSRLLKWFSFLFQRIGFVLLLNMSYTDNARTPNADNLFILRGGCVVGPRKTSDFGRGGLRGLKMTLASSRMSSSRSFESLETDSCRCTLSWSPTLGQPSKENPYNNNNILFRCMLYTFFVYARYRPEKYSLLTKN